MARKEAWCSLLTLFFLWKVVHCRFLGRPTFESGWLDLVAQDDVISYLEVPHGLGEIPALVDVQVKAVDGPNQDFVFTGTGTGERDDDARDDYGGVVYIYNSEVVRLFAPNHNNNNHHGAAIYTGAGPYWKGVNTQTSMAAKVKVRCWTSARLPVPHFHQSNIPLTCGSTVVSDTYVELNHGLGDYPEFVKVRVHMQDGLNKDLVTDAQGACSISFDHMGSWFKTGGLKFAYNNETVRVWTSSYTHPDCFIFSVEDGWGTTYTHVASARVGTLEVSVWRDFVVTPVFETRFPIGPSETDEQLEIPLNIDSNTVDDVMISVTTEAIDGSNTGYRFTGIGSAMDNNYLVDPLCAYGGLVFAFNQSALRLWRPDYSTGSVICISTHMGRGTNIQASQSAIIDVRIWAFAKLYPVKEVALTLHCSHHRLYMTDHDILTAPLLSTSTTNDTSIVSCHNVCREMFDCQLFTTGKGFCNLFKNFSSSDIISSVGMQIWTVESVTPSNHGN